MEDKQEEAEPKFVIKDRRHSAVPPPLTAEDVIRNAEAKGLDVDAELHEYGFVDGESMDYADRDLMREHAPGSMCVEVDDRDGDGSTPIVHAEGDGFREANEEEANDIARKLAEKRAVTDSEKQHEDASRPRMQIVTRDVGWPDGQPAVVFNAPVHFNASFVRAYCAFVKAGSITMAGQDAPPIKRVLRMVFIADVNMPVREMGFCLMHESMGITMPAPNEPAPDFVDAIVDNTGVPWALWSSPQGTASDDASESEEPPT